MRAEYRHRSARAVLRAATVAMVTRPSIERSVEPGRDRATGERCLLAARGPENAAPPEARVTELRCREGCARNRALGASAEFALRMPLWRTGGVPCGTEVMSPPYARSTWSSTSSCPHQSDDHRVVANRCRAQASSMPEGPAIGRVEAKRRALTMPSTAPASSARWWCGPIRACD
jgi:hypothetical protein